MRFLHILLLSVLVIVAPYFMPGKNTQLLSLLLSYFWIGLTFTAAIVYFFMFLRESLKKEYSSTNLNDVIQRLKQVLVVIFLNWIVFLSYPRCIRYYQILKLENIIEKYDLFNKSKDQIPLNLEKYIGVKTKSKSIHSELYPIHEQNSQSLAHIRYWKHEFVESSECQIYYTKDIEKLKWASSFKKIKSGKHGYHWYEWCRY